MIVSLHPPRFWSPHRKELEHLAPKLTALIADNALGAVLFLVGDEVNRRCCLETPPAGACCSSRAPTSRAALLRVILRELQYGDPAVYQPRIGATGTKVVVAVQGLITRCPRTGS